MTPPAGGTAPPFGAAPIPTPVLPDRAGYYPDPATGGQYERWWDGREWLDETRPAGGPPAAAVPAHAGPTERHPAPETVGTAGWSANAETRPSEGQILGGHPVVSTAEHLADQEIAQVLGPVCGDATLGGGLWSDLASGVRQFVSGQTRDHLTELHAARAAAVASLRDAAVAAGADAVVSTRFLYQSIGTGTLLVTAYGTAVRAPLGARTATQRVRTEPIATAATTPTTPLATDPPRTIPATPAGRIAT